MPRLRPVFFTHALQRSRHAEVGKDTVEGARRERPEKIGRGMPGRPPLHVRVCGWVRLLASLSHTHNRSYIIPSVYRVSSTRGRVDLAPEIYSLA